MVAWAQFKYLGLVSDKQVKNDAVTRTGYMIPCVQSRHNPWPTPFTGVEGKDLAHMDLEEAVSLLRPQFWFLYFPQGMCFEAQLKVTALLSNILPFKNSPVTFYPEKSDQDARQWSCLLLPNLNLINDAEWEQSSEDTLPSVSPSYILYVKIMYGLVRVDPGWIPGAH